MDEKFNFCLKAGKIDIEELENDLARKNEKIEKITRVRTYLLDSTMECPPAAPLPWRDGL